MTYTPEPLDNTVLPVHAELAGSYIDWPAILAGSVIAAGVGSMFSTFGLALGLSTISPYEGAGNATAALVAVGCWMVWTTSSAFMTGAYVAGRMRRRVEAATLDEVAVRDGIHGLAVWGVAILLGVLVLSGAVDGAATAIAPMAGDIAQQVATETAAPLPVVDQQELARVARNYTIVSAFVTAASLLIAGAGAYWAASVGGRHRDEGHVSARFGPWI